MPFQQLNLDNIVWSETAVQCEPTAITCDSPSTIKPPDAPICFTATATSNCGFQPSVTDYDCYKRTKKGENIDKTGSCAVSITGNEICILDSGGVGTIIEWTVTAADEEGNVDAMATCALNVVKPGRGQNLRK